MKKYSYYSILKFLTSTVCAFLLINPIFANPTHTNKGSHSTPFATGKKIYITKGSDNGKYINGKYFDYAPGDTLVLKASGNPYSYFSLEGINGAPGAPVIIMNEGGQVQLKDGISAVSCTYLKILGTGSSDQYGFKVEDPASWGVGINISGRSSDIEVSNVYIHNKTYGFWIKQEASCDDALNAPSWVINNISVHDCFVQKVNQEGFYVGSTNTNGVRPITCNGVTRYPVPLRLGNVKIYNNIVDYTFRSGIQLSNAEFGENEIYGNTVTNCGYEYNTDQGNGIAIGGYTHAYVHDNVINHTYTNGIYSLGAGLVRIENNKIDNSGNLGGTSVKGMSSIMIDTRKTSPILKTQFYVKNNSLGSNSDFNVRVYKTYDTYEDGNIICSNTTTSGYVTMSVASGIDWSNCGNNVGRAPVADAGPAQTITLPKNSVNLWGNGSDPDGFITAYNWRKVSGPSQFTLESAGLATAKASNLVAGDYEFELKVTDNTGVSSTGKVLITVKDGSGGTGNTPGGTPTPTPTPTPSGSTQDVPGKIEAESYSQMNGIQTEPTADAGGGQDLGYIDAGDWMDYKVNVATAGTYTFSARVACPYNGSELQLKNASGTILATLNIPVTGGWQSFTTLTSTVSLPAGAQTLRIYASKGGWNFNWMQFATSSPSPSPSPTPSDGDTTGSSKRIQVNIIAAGSQGLPGWNGWAIPSASSTATLSSLKYSDGSASTIDATLSNNTGTGDNGSSYGGSMAPAEVLRYTSYSTQNRTLTLSGLTTSKTYSLELYASRGANQYETTTFTINGVAKSITTYNNLTNKALFTGLTPNASGQIIVSISKDPTRTYAYLNGFTLSETTGTSTTSGIAANEKAGAITDEAGSSLFSLYPNPVQDHVTVQIGSTETGTVTIQVIAADGSVKKEIHLLKDQSSPLQSYLSLGDLPAGSYTLKAQIGNWSTTLNFNKQ